jgi:hypothetical protein
VKEAGQYTADLARGLPEDSIGGGIVAGQCLFQTVFVALTGAPDGSDDRRCKQCDKGVLSAGNGPKCVIVVVGDSGRNQATGEVTADGVAWRTPQLTTSATTKFLH